MEKYWRRDKALRVEVGKDCFAAWDFPSTVNQANEAIANQNELFKKHSINCKSSRDYEGYITQVRNNIAALATGFQ